MGIGILSDFSDHQRQRSSPACAGRDLEEVQVVMGTATVQFAPTAGFAGAVYVVFTPPVVRVTSNACGPPQLIPIITRVYLPDGRIDCGMTVYATGLLNPDLMWQ